MAVDYPVTFDIVRPREFQRLQVIFRTIILLVISLFVGITTLLGLNYALFPLLSAFYIWRKGSQRFLQEDGPRLTSWLRRNLAFYAYLGLLADRLPVKGRDDFVHLEVRTGGSPTVASALLRLIYGIPNAVALVLLGVASGIVWAVASLMVLIRGSYPERLFDFQRGVLRWQARFLAYHASLVDRYPPFALDTGAEAASPTRAASAA